MLLPPPLRSLEARRLPSRARRRQPWRRRRPLLEGLEDRRLLAAIVVNNPTDTPVTGQIDLREAITMANDNSGADTITFDPGVFSTPQTIALTAGQLTLTDTTGATTITGPSVGVTIARSTAATLNFRIMSVNSGVTATLENLTITGGNAGSESSGGAILNSGTLTLTNSTLSGNSAGGSGGGIYNANFSGSSATLTLTNATLSDNLAGSYGGGIANFGSGTGNFGTATLTLTNSTLSHNSANIGGGISNFGTATLTNSTLSDNSANNSAPGGCGGAICNEPGATLTLTNSTLSGNTARLGGGIYNHGYSGSETTRLGMLTLTHSTLSDNSSNSANSGGGIDNRGMATLNNIIVANSPSGSDVTNITPGTITGSHNLIETPITGGGSNTLTGTIMADPLLGPLQNNGGPTQTMALRPGSPAINAGDNALIPAGITTDQRGVPFARIAGGTVDIGAYEVQSLRLVVDTTSDVDNGNFSPGDFSLREAIGLANAFPGPDTISFAIPGAGVHTISLISALPEITDPVVIDGTTQPGIVISGELLSKNGLPNAGLTIGSVNTTVRGLVINGFLNDMGGAGVVLQGLGGDVLEYNFIGTDPTGTVAVPNFQGVLILGSSNNRIGGTSTVQRNLISGNRSAGVQILNSETVKDPTQPYSDSQIGPASNNLIEGNFIGTDITGTPRLGNGQGVFVNDASRNTIRGNLISGNSTIDVQILGENAIGNHVVGNTIGTDRDGNRTLTGRFGVYVYAAQGNDVSGNNLQFNNQNGFRTRNLADGPEVESVELKPGKGAATTSIVLTFTTYLDRGRANDTKNYLVNLVGNRLRPGRSIPVLSATYDGINRTVTLALARPIPPGALFQLRVVGRKGRAPRGITDRPGNPLDGINTLPAPRGGSDDVLYFRQGVQVNPIPVSAGRGPGLVPRGRRQRPVVQRRQRATLPVHVGATHAASRALSAAAIDAVFGSGRPLNLHLSSRR